MNILVLGSDSRDGPGNGIDDQKGIGGRSDTTILLHVSADRKEAYGVSLPRDALVDRPDCETTDGDTIPGEHLAMFNSAFEVGGVACTIQTVEALTNIRVDDAIVVDFNGFKDMVDAVNGVEVCLPKEVSDPEHGIYFDAGTQTLEGQQALNYVRERTVLSPTGDIGRMKRQQAFIASMVNQVKSAGTLTRPDRIYKLPRGGHRLAQDHRRARQPERARGPGLPAAAHGTGQDPVRHRAVRGVRTQPQPAGLEDPGGERPLGADPARRGARSAVRRRQPGRLRPGRLALPWRRERRRTGGGTGQRPLRLTRSQRASASTAVGTAAGSSVGRRCRIAAARPTPTNAASAPTRKHSWNAPLVGNW